MKMKQLALAVASLGCVMTAFPGAAQAGELDEMKAMLQKLQARIDTLEAQKAAAPAATPAVTAGNPALFANSSVTLYGKLDVFTDYATGGGTGTRLAFNSGGMNGTRWGIKGGADIASGVRGIFQVEGGFFANNGQMAQSSSKATIFGRQAYVGVEGKFGRLTTGRQYGVFYNATQAYDPFEQGYGSPTNDGQFDSGSVRYDNSLIYASPKFGDFTANAMVALAPVGQINSTVGGNTGGNKHYVDAFALNYNPGDFGATLAYQKDDHIADATATKKWNFGGVSYQIGNTRLSAGISHTRKETSTNVITKRSEWMVGSKTKLTSTGTLLAVAGHGKTDGIADESTAVALGWIEAISAQTNVYGVLARNTNGIAAANAPAGTNSSDSYTVNKGSTPIGLALGLQYSF